jgi:hypothetical protein
LEETDYDDICAGIHTSAVEGYGKILYLQNLKRMKQPKDNTVKVLFTSDERGFLNHDHKFNLALSALPESCGVLRGPDYDPEDYDGNDYVMDTSADMKARMSVFYADFHESMAILHLKANRSRGDLLVKAVDDFLARIRARNY